jgi:ABC-type nitrate/sulfonate/bicarbonate transport system substrate-binding protein
MKIAVPDLISNSYFPAIAAVELGLFAEQGLEMEHRLIFPVDACFKALKDGEIDFVGGSAHAVLSAFPDWQGARLLCAQAQGMYWFLVMNAELGARPGEVEVVKGRRIGAAPWVDMGLRRLLAEAGIDIEKDAVDIAPVPGAVQPGVSFGVTAARALADGKLDGFWANGMGAETAVRSGAGTVVLDVRRGDGPAAAFNYTQPIIATTERLIADQPEAAAAAVRAIVATQRVLKQDVGRATEVGEALFSPVEADMIADVVERDLPFYDAAISPDFVAGMNRFAVDIGLIDAAVPYDRVVATEFSDLWTA